MKIKKCLLGIFCISMLAPMSKTEFREKMTMNHGYDKNSRIDNAHFKIVNGGVQVFRKHNCDLYWVSNSMGVEWLHANYYYRPLAYSEAGKVVAFLNHILDNYSSSNKTQDEYRAFLASSEYEKIGKIEFVFSNKANVILPLCEASDEKDKESVAKLQELRQAEKMQEINDPFRFAKLVKDAERTNHWFHKQIQNLIKNWLKEFEEFNWSKTAIAE